MRFIKVLCWICVFQVIRRDLARTMARKRPDRVQHGWILHQDNAPAHASQEVQTTIQIQMEAQI